MLNKSEFEVCNSFIEKIFFIRIQKETLRFYDIMKSFEEKKMYFSTEDFFILLRTHLVMMDFSYKKIEKYFNKINVNVQNKKNTLIEQKSIIDVEEDVEEKVEE